MAKVAPLPARDPLLTVEEFAELFGTSVHYPRGLIKQKRIQYVKLGPGRRSPVRIRQSVAERFIADHTIEALG